MAQASIKLGLQELRQWSRFIANNQDRTQAGFDKGGEKENQAGKVGHGGSAHKEWDA